ncbi:YaaC family protein [Thiococcus pfennigii]|uniref:YaaC family protein n=1 Tax=Thiococcus pfennigii TaxID=1057 RepID=UPI00190583E5|nr:YaaC family protein [Thiococcus pfennigii]MBK1733394.1 hypothetical protein [Thiococcus pfennigii]
MPKNILVENGTVTALGRNSLFDLTTDYAGMRAAYEAALEQHKELGKNADSLPKYLKEQGVVDYRDEAYLPAKKLHLLRSEAKKRQESAAPCSLLPLDATGYQSEAMALLANLENDEVIKQVYKRNNHSLGQSRNAGLTTGEALRIKYCLRQGRDLFNAGHVGPALVKPLNYFYSLTAYAYGLIVTRNPLRNKVEQIPGSHGLDYINDGVYFRFGGDRKQGTFSDLHGSHTNTLIFAADTDFSINRANSITKYHENSAVLSVGTLYSMVPELKDYYRIVTGHGSRCHPLEISRTGDRTSLAWEWRIGNGVHKPEREDIEKSFPDCAFSEKHGKYVISIAQDQLDAIDPIVQSDARNHLWYTENPIHPICLSTLDMHFLITCALSNIMRYSPDKWGSILLNEVDGNISLITQRYLSSLEAVLPLIVLRELSPYYPYVRDGLTSR